MIYVCNYKLNCYIVWVHYLLSYTQEDETIWVDSAIYVQDKFFVYCLSRLYEWFCLDCLLMDGQSYLLAFVDGLHYASDHLDWHPLFLNWKG
jgi:hypothetical protein